jgi:two-component system, NarL family, nitrate/nitrite response regulator NarL
MTPEPCPVFVIGEIRFYRESLAAFLADRAGLAVRGTAASATEAASLFENDGAPIVLLDVAHPADLNGVRQIRSVAPHAQVIALGLPELEREVLECAEEGIVGFVGRNRSLEELVGAIERAARGELECSPTLTAALLRHVGRLAAERRHAPGGVPLTPREHEIVVLIEQGLSNKEIARQLHIELPTVKNHVHNLLEKLHVATRGQAAALVRTLPPGS